MIDTLLQGRWWAVWQRNFLVWQKMAGASLLANFAEPLLNLLILGYGLGMFVGRLQGMSYMTFLATGVICYGAMSTATFEGLYSAYTRMAVQQTWHGMLATPLNVEDIVLGEICWAATKSFINVTAVFIVAAGLGMVILSWQVLWIWPVLWLVALCFAAMALVTTALARGYDFFLYYMTLLITPMTLLSGVFFPLESLPDVIQMAMMWFPLAHAINLTRPLMIGQTVPLAEVWVHLGVIIGYAMIATYVAVRLLKKRLHN